MKVNYWDLSSHLYYWTGNIETLKLLTTDKRNFLATLKMLDGILKHENKVMIYPFSESVA